MLAQTQSPCPKGASRVTARLAGVLSRARKDETGGQTGESPQTRPPPHPCPALGASSPGAPGFHRASRVYGDSRHGGIEILKIFLCPGQPPFIHYSVVTEHSRAPVPGVGGRGRVRGALACWHTCLPTASLCAGWERNGEWPPQGAGRAKPTPRPTSGSPFQLHAGKLGAALPGTWHKDPSHTLDPYITFRGPL